MKEVTILIWRFVQGFIDEHGYSPTLREIGRGVYLAHGNVGPHLQKLVAAGVLSVAMNQKRSIKLLARLDEDAARRWLRKGWIERRRRERK